uniref:Uncharacterized protein n=1 Tax=Electrophorus electricus TaxID=8005 RepID=A0A4W4E4I5_ELEEL
MCAVTRLYIVGCSFLCIVSADKGLESKGRDELQKVLEFATLPRYGECWSRALEKIHTRCREFSDDMQSMIALAFTHCHLRRSGRSFPECPEGSDVKTCTRNMDPVAFNAYTEFFTHAHSICHYLQGERWQHQAENTINRYFQETKHSASVAERLVSTQRMAEDLVEAQSMTLKSQEAILRNGEELKHTLQDSAKGLRDVFAEMRHSVQEQQIAFVEVFNRVAFLQSFIMAESHTLSSLFYNALGFCASFLLTSTRRTCGEQISSLVGLLRKVMVLIGCFVLVYFAVQFRNINRESLEILRELKETHSNLQETLQRAGKTSVSAHTISQIVLEYILVNAS